MARDLPNPICSAAAVVLHDLYRIAYVQRLLLAELSREAASDATSAEARVRVVGLRRAKVLSWLTKISQPIFPDLPATTNNIAGPFLGSW